MSESAFMENFRIVRNWNSSEKLEDLLRFNPDDGSVKRAKLQLNRTKLLKVHPLFFLMAEKGFSPSDVARHGFNMSILECEDTLMSILNELTNVGIMDMKVYDNHLKYWIDDVYNIKRNSDYLLEQNSVTSRTNGDLITTLIANSGKSLEKQSNNSVKGKLSQIFVLLFFIRNSWYELMRYGLTHGTNRDKFKFFSDFFSNYINLDLLANDHLIDLETRANLIQFKFKSIWDEGKICRRIILTDGHGRILMRIMKKLAYGIGFSGVDQNLYLNQIDSIRISVYETDWESNLWHEYIFPISDDPNIPTCISANILNKNLRDNTLNSNGIIYLNFDKMGGNSDILMNYVETTDQKNLPQLIISFSVSGKASVNYNNLIPELENIGFERLVMLDGSLRQDLLTYYMLE